MCTRGVWQLRSLLVQYCNHSGSSSGTRRFAEQMLIPFAKENPQIEIAVSLKPNNHPIVTGFYEKDPEKTLSLRNLSAEQVQDRIQMLRDARPITLRKWHKKFRDSPSVQGEWELGQILDRPHKTICG